MNKIEQFIIFLNDLTTDMFYDRLYTTGENIFMNGGCYTFANIIKKYYPSSEIVLKNDNTHCGILYEDEVYDATLKRNDKEEFHIANQEDIYYMEDKFGGHLNNLNIYDVITNEIAKIERISFLFEGGKTLKKVGK